MVPAEIFNYSCIHSPFQKKSPAYCKLLNDTCEAILILELQNQIFHVNFYLNILKMLSDLHVSQKTQFLHQITLSFGIFSCGVELSFAGVHTGVSVSADAIILSMLPRYAGSRTLLSNPDCRLVSGHPWGVHVVLGTPQHQSHVKSKVLNLQIRPTLSKLNSKVHNRLL